MSPCGTELKDARPPAGAERWRGQSGFRRSRLPSPRAIREARPRTAGAVRVPFRSGTRFPWKLGRPVVDEDWLADGALDAPAPKLAKLERPAPGPPARDTRPGWSGSTGALRSLRTAEVPSQVGDPAGPVLPPRAPEPVPSGLLVLSAATRLHLARADAYRKECPPVSRPKAGFGSDRARSLFWAREAANALMGVMPPEARAGALGGQAAAAQVPAADAGTLVQSAILARAGPCGESLVAAYRAANFVRGYELARQAEEPAFRALPMEPGLTALLVKGEATRAIEAGRGSRGGSSVGPGTISAFKTLRSVGWPIMGLDDPVVKGAAGSTAASGTKRKTAATLAPGPWIQVEFIARCSAQEVVELFESAGKRRGPQGCWMLRFIARSSAMADVVSARMQDAARVEFYPDEHCPSANIRGEQWMAKDGEEIDLFGPATGILGPFVWIEEHLADIARLGQTFPRWSGPHGSASDISLAAAFLPETADKGEIRKAVFAVWRAPPLQMSEEERKALNQQGHSIHGALADIARMVSEFPQLPFALPEHLRRGFTRTEVRMYGHWLRDKNATDEAPPQRRGNGPARPPGAAAARREMGDRYSRGEGRLGERAEQLTARRRIMELLALAYREWGRSWLELPRDPSGWTVLLPLERATDEEV